MHPYFLNKIHLDIFHMMLLTFTIKFHKFLSIFFYRLSTHQNMISSDFIFVVKKKASSKDFLRACVLKNFGFAERPQQFKRLRHKSVVRDSGAAAQLCASSDPL